MPKAPTEIRSLARSYTESAVKTLAGIMKQPEAPPAARVAAATALLDRGWGKPAQFVTDSSEEFEKHMKDDDLMAELREQASELGLIPPTGASH